MAGRRGGRNPLLPSAPGMAEMSAEELAKLAQNAVGNLISLPFQTPRPQ
ncbi:MAG TPA: hypothetical protein VES73_17075 [Lamprocystis sp. (in: g-proteobacteria)]|nr:hypothetical protein [Lamprocystis sp. (in: g-proteobacteria)]